MLKSSDIAVPGGFRRAHLVTEKRRDGVEAKRVSEEALGVSRDDADRGRTSGAGRSSSGESSAGAAEADNSDIKDALRNLPF